MSSIFINSENSKTSDALGQRLDFTDKIDLQRSDNRVAFIIKA